MPFIQKPDGSYLMDSFAIFEWLEETYPDRQSTYASVASDGAVIWSTFDPATQRYRISSKGMNHDGWISVLAKDKGMVVLFRYRSRVDKGQRNCMS